MKLRRIYEAMNSKKVQTILQRNPNFFKSTRTVELGLDYGAFDFILKIDSDEIDEWVKGDYNISNRKTKDGRTISIGLFETILSGDTWELWDTHSYDGDWESVLDYHISEENKKTINEIINKLILDSGKEPEEFKDVSLQDLINEFDDNNDISSALSSSLSDAEADSYVSHLRETLMECLEEYGDVKSLNYDGAEIQIEMSNWVDKFDFTDPYVRDDDFLDFMEYRCEWDSECFFKETINEYDEFQPKFSIDDRWYPNVDDNYLNEILEDRLGELL